MPRIVYIKESKGGGYVIVGVADGEEKYALVVDKATYSSIAAPPRGHEITNEEMTVMRAADGEYRALKKALSLLSYADNSKRNLKMKLLRAGFSSSSADEAIREVVRLGYLNEDEQIRRAILYEVNSRLTGPMKLVSKLSAKGYSVSLIKAAVGALSDEGLVDFDENRRALLDKKLDADATPEQKQKLLKSYGYKCYD